MFQSPRNMHQGLLRDVLGLGANEAWCFLEPDKLRALSLIDDDSSILLSHPS